MDYNGYERGKREGRLYAYNGYSLGYCPLDLVSNKDWHRGKMTGYNEVILMGLYGILKEQRQYLWGISSESIPNDFAKVINEDFWEII